MTTYAGAILEGFRYLLRNYPEVFILGQGVWSPWYVGSSMKDLDKEFGTDRVIDTPVSELATTAAGVGAGLFGMRPIVIHPRMDFFLLASDPVVNQAAKWRHMLGGQAGSAVTIRAIINRGGEQGAQHSQALHSWYAHIPGLRVVMPATPRDARDLLIASVLCDDPVIYIDDRWLYDLEETLPDAAPVSLTTQGPQIRREGDDLTLCASGHSVRLAMEAAEALAEAGVSAEVVDLRVLHPLDPSAIVTSVEKTGRLIAIDGSWRTCGFSAEIIASVAERLPFSAWRATPQRITLPDAPAPTSRVLEEIYYPGADDIVLTAQRMLEQSQ
ncbi:MAG: alpha-ketoacid dehydrogenase subunit beta [Candidatus Dadabacteria bacterium]|nr:MAG: alpha-ketoacid dehydrogenase subunit beta [Candidatus Dadabacteria bacterium]